MSGPRCGVDFAEHAAARVRRDRLGQDAHGARAQRRPGRAPAHPRLHVQLDCQPAVRVACTWHLPPPLMRVCRPPRDAVLMLAGGGLLAAVEAGGPRAGHALHRCRGWPEGRAAHFPAVDRDSAPRPGTKGGDVRKKIHAYAEPPRVATRSFRPPCQASARALIRTWRRTTTTLWCRPSATTSVRLGFKGW